MASSDMRKRQAQTVPQNASVSATSPNSKNGDPFNPSGKAPLGVSMQILRMVSFTTWFMMCCASIGTTQYLGVPLYWINKDYFYAYMALTKQSFGLLAITITEWFSPTLVRVSGDATVRGQLRKTPGGTLETVFPDRMIMISNHQIYTDWLYLWWIAYTSRMHGHIFIILKESLKWMPIIGPGMQFFGFIFIGRNWTSDKPRIAHRLETLTAQHSGPMSPADGLDPMWLLIYPEGTNLSANTRKRSKAWAEKQNIPDLRNQLLPRSTGLFFCLQKLQSTVEWVYDCTVAYEGANGGYAQDYYTLRSVYFQGRPPKSVNMYWRRFPVSSIPIHDAQEFDEWINARWKEKEVFLDHFYKTGLLPADDGHIDTEVRLGNWYEIWKIFAVLATLALVLNVIEQVLAIMSSVLSG